MNLEILTANIVIVGPQGCGKTSIGKGLAQILQLPFHDGDEMYQGKYKSNIGKDLVQNPFWGRNRESELIEGLINSTKISKRYGIISPGGGFVRPTTLGLTTEKVDEFTKKHAQLLEDQTVIYLQPHEDLDEMAEICYRRVQRQQNNNRISFGDDKFKSFKNMIHDRHSYYDKVANGIIIGRKDEIEFTPHQMINQTYEWLKEYDPNLTEEIGERWEE